jgi:hypothetical protein
MGFLLFGCFSCAIATGEQCPLLSGPSYPSTLGRFRPKQCIQGFSTN